MVLGHDRVFTPRVRFVRCGRFWDIGFTGPRVRSWLQAEVRARLVNVRSCTDNGHCSGEVCFRSD